MSEERYVHDPENESGAAGSTEPRPPGERRFDWRGWTLVGMVVLAFFVAPGVLLVLPYTGHPLSAFGLTWKDTFLTLPFLPALVLGVTAVWATTRR